MASYRHNWITESDLQPGDHIYRWKYWAVFPSKHQHGIYIGDNKVIHFVCDNLRNKLSMCGDCQGYNGDRRTGVIKSCVKCFCKNHKLARFEYGQHPRLVSMQHEFHNRPDEADDATTVIRRAELEIERQRQLFAGREVVNPSLNFCVFCKTRLRSGSRIAPSDLLPGDHIYCFRQGVFEYSHHGIFIGDNKVIHFSGDKIFSKKTKCDDCKDYYKINEGVVRSCLKCFQKGHTLRLYQYSEHFPNFLIYKRKPVGTRSRTKADDPTTVVGRATDALENGFGNYNLLYRNCETFSHSCMAGYKMSHQSLHRFASLGFSPLLNGIRERNRTEYNSDAEEST